METTEDEIESVIWIFGVTEVLEGDIWNAEDISAVDNTLLLKEDVSTPDVIWTLDDKGAGDVRIGTPEDIATLEGGIIIPDDIVAWCDEEISDEGIYTPDDDNGALEEKTVTTEIDDEGKTDEYIETVENIGMPPVETRLSKEVTGTLGNTEEILLDNIKTPLDDIRLSEDDTGTLGNTEEMPEDNTGTLLDDIGL